MLFGLVTSQFRTSSALVRMVSGKVLSGSEHFALLTEQGDSRQP